MKKIFIIMIPIVLIIILVVYYCFIRVTEVQDLNVEDVQIENSEQIKDLNTEKVQIVDNETQKADETVNDTDKLESSISINSTGVNNSKVVNEQKTIKENNKQEKIDSISKQNVQANTPSVTSSENKKSEVTTEEKKTSQLVEEYKINQSMINTMKSFITNNKTEDMINYGYEIVVDSFIVELTNQFTYTEQRLLNKIQFKYGTIRIYARDYYCNGQYVTTQCFII